MTDSNAKYIEAMRRLYGADKPHTCQRPGCRTVILKSKTHCLKHSPPRKDQAFKFQNAHRGRH
jgi:hypothetical protein